MNYEVDKENYRVLISGSTAEIGDWIRLLDLVISKGRCSSQLEEDLENLHNINEMTQFNFNNFERIYYNKDSLLIVPNVTLSARDFYFGIIEDHFEKAKNYLNS